MAAGRGERMGAPVNKVYLPLGDRPVICYSIAVFEESPLISCYVVVARPEEISFCRTLLAYLNPKKLAAVVPGGERRQDSVLAGLRALPGDCALVAVHDGARPLLQREVLEGALHRAGASGAVVVGVPVKDTIKLCDDQGRVAATPERRRLWQAQTPQVFGRQLLERAYAAFGDGAVTDDASMVERLGVAVELFPGGYDNLKVTTTEDLALAEALLSLKSGCGSRRESERARVAVRTGIGYDVHPFDPGRKLVLGGVEIPGAQGLAGHSDADVLLHALMDACLGGAGLRDIGQYFPPSDERWRDASSLALLAVVRMLLVEAGFRVVQVDLVVAAERPRLADHIPSMKERIGAVLGLSAGLVGIKATTSEGLGFVGRGEGIAAWAVANLVAVEP